jgi:hypothetical protein
MCALTSKLICLTMVWIPSTHGVKTRAFGGGGGWHEGGRQGANEGVVFIFVTCVLSWWSMILIGQTAWTDKGLEVKVFIFLLFFNWLLYLVCISSFFNIFVSTIFRFIINLNWYVVFFILEYTMNISSGSFKNVIRFLCVELVTDQVVHNCARYIYTYNAL